MEIITFEGLKFEQFILKPNFQCPCVYIFSCDENGDCDHWYSVVVLPQEDRE